MTNQTLPCREASMEDARMRGAFECAWLRVTEHGAMNKAASRRLWDEAIAFANTRAQSSAPEGSEYEHHWSDDGERCLKCGDKDWMGGKCSMPDQSEDESGEPIRNCTVCGSPVMYGERHHRCGSAILEAEAQVRRELSTTQEGDEAVAFAYAYVGKPRDDGYVPMDFVRAAGRWDGELKKWADLHECEEIALYTRSNAQDGDDMLNRHLAPHSKEWYTLCERAAYVDKITISGPLAEVIVKALSTSRSNDKGTEGENG